MMSETTRASGSMVTETARARLSALQMEQMRADVLERRPPVLAVEHAREKLRVASTVVRELSLEACGELAAEARLLWLYSMLPLGTVHDIAGALTLVNDVVGFVENWSDCFDPRRRSSTPQRDRYEAAAKTLQEVECTCSTPADFTAHRRGLELLQAAAEATGERKPLYERNEEEFHTKLVQPAVKACGEALEALNELVDEIRDSAPEVLR